MSSGRNNHPAVLRRSALILIVASALILSPPFAVTAVAQVITQQAPVIENIFPPAAWPGTPVTIQGTDFGDAQLPLVSTVTFNGVDAGTAVLWTDTYIVVVVPEGATSGPVVVTTMTGTSNPHPFTVYEQPQAVPCYFAEGTTRAGFEEWLTLYNPHDSEFTATVTYMVAQGANRIRYYNIPAHSRMNVYVNSEIGSDRDVSLVITAPERIYAERPVYFRYGTGWLGGHCTAPALDASQDWYFAEGTTRAGFEEWLCLANPGAQDAEVQVTYLFPEGNPLTCSYTVPAWKRFTVNVNQVVGSDKDVALEVHSNQPIVAERSMYFNYRGVWNGGHVTMGAPSPGVAWYFAEGTTRAGFEEWLCLANPGSEKADVKVRYHLDRGEVIDGDIILPPGKRLTVFVNQVVGPDKDVALEVHSNQPIVAERSMYFNYRGVWNGGHVTMGAPSPGVAWYFAEGTTRAGFEEWLCLFNPGAEDAKIRVWFEFSGGGSQEKSLVLPSGMRATLFVNQEVGADKDVSVHVESAQGIVAERSLYFLYHHAWEGGHNSLGIAP